VQKILRWALQAIGLLGDLECLWCLLLYSRYRECYARLDSCIVRMFYYLQFDIQHGLGIPGVGYAVYRLCVRQSVYDSSGSVCLIPNVLDSIQSSRGALTVLHIHNVTYSRCYVNPYVGKYVIITGNTI